MTSRRFITRRTSTKTPPKRPPSRRNTATIWRRQRPGRKFPIRPSSLPIRPISTARSSPARKKPSTAASMKCWLPKAANISTRTASLPSIRKPVCVRSTGSSISTRPRLCLRARPTISGMNSAQALPRAPSRSISIGRAGRPISTIRNRRRSQAMSASFPRRQDRAASAPDGRAITASRSPNPVTTRRLPPRSSGS